jgi:hypothetical protein
MWLVFHGHPITLPARDGELDVKSTIKVLPNTVIFTEQYRFRFATIVISADNTHY